MNKGLLYVLPILFSVMSIVSNAQKKGEHWIYDHDTTVYDTDSNLYVVENLGENVNTDHVESGPRISPDGKMLYFFMIEYVDNPYKDDYPDIDKWPKRTIYFSEFNEEDSTWGKAEKAPEPLNNLGDNSVHSISPDGKTLLLHNVYRKDGLTDDGVSISKLEGKEWSFPEPVSIKHFHNDTVCSFFVSEDNEFLLLAIRDKKDKGALGMQDLYVSFLDHEGHYGEPINLGPVVNSKMSEATAFLASDHKTLYFSSNRRGGLGGYDIYKTERLDSTWLKWSKPENLGPPWNTHDDEFYFSIPSDGEYSYLAHHFTTVDGKEHSDIVRVKMKEEWKPRILVLTGRLFDNKTKERIPGTVTFLETKKDSLIDTFTLTDSTDFTVNLPVPDVYEYIAASAGYDTLHNELNLSRMTKYKEDTIDIYLDRIPIMTVTGKIFDEYTHEPIAANIVFEEISGDEVANKNLSVDEPYVVELPGGKKYKYSIESPGYFPEVSELDLTRLAQNDEQTINVYLKPLAGLKFEVENIFFETGKWDLLPESNEELDKLVAQMKRIKSKVLVEISGHTDNVGSESSNQRLSENRAKSVVKYLVSHGIEASSLKAKGYGELKPKDTNDTPEGRQNNRRVEFEILKVD